MNFLKKLFGSKKKVKEDEENISFGGVYASTYFDNRYEEENMEPQMVDGCLKMVESYFMDNKIERRVKSPINHPINLDQLDQEGFGFVLYCKAFQLSEGQAMAFLAFAFSDYLIKNYGFKLFNDKKPEYPLRSMTLKYDVEGTVLSLYPFEYASKVLSGNETFSKLENKVKLQVGQLPEMNKVVQKFIKPDTTEL
jgi:hypothetical protein